MDPYTVSLLLGGVGLGAMALTGIGRHGHHSGTSHGHAHGHGHGHAGSHAGSHAGAPTGAHAGHGHGGAQASALAHSVSGVSGAASRTAWALMSPRILFSLLIGVGTSGILLRPLLAGPLLLAAAIAGGIVFERTIVSPLWNFVLRFASRPALTLESSVTDEATAVTSFDANGQGIVAVEVDGQVVQVLGTLQASDRALGARVNAGERVRIEEVDAARNRCIVSLL